MIGKCANAQCQCLGKVPKLWRQPAFGGRQRKDWLRPHPHHIMTERNFPAPWRFEEIQGGYCILDANNQVLAYVYAGESQEAYQDGALTWKEAWLVARAIARLPEVMHQVGP
jgi:hypothetical protein